MNDFSMDIWEVEELLKAIPSSEVDMIRFYKLKQLELVSEINKALKNKGLPIMTLAEMLATPKPE